MAKMLQISASLRPLQFKELILKVETIGIVVDIRGMSELYDIDACGLLCPLPVLKARKFLSDLPSGSVIRILADDPAAAIDMPHFCYEGGHELIDSKSLPEGQLYCIRKG